MLNFGLPAPIDVQVAGRDDAKNREAAQVLLAKLKGVRGVVDAHMQQIVDAPEYTLTVDRARALELSLSEQQVANNLNISLSSSTQVTPNFWADPVTGIPYPVAVQTPEYRIASIGDLENTPLAPKAGSSAGASSVGASAASTALGSAPVARLTPRRKVKSRLSSDTAEMRKPSTR